MKAKSEKGIRTRQRILDAARDLIEQRGARSTSVDDVLKASGTGKSQFYHYFGSKDLMVREVITQQARSLPTDHVAIVAAIKSVADVELWLDQIIVDYDKGLYPNGCPIGNLASELASSDLHRENLAKTFSEWEEALAKAIMRMRSANMIAADIEPHGLAMFIVSTIEGAFLLAKTDRKADPLLSAKEHVMNYLRSLKAGGGRSGARKKTLGFCP